jgi:hypothetical protein
MKRGRIPTKLAAFVTYVIVVNDYLHVIVPGGTDPRGITLGLTTAELSALDVFAKKLMSGDAAHPGIWDLHSNKDTKTQGTAARMKKIKKEFEDFFRPLLNRMNASSTISEDDRITLCLSDPVTHHSRPVDKITAHCYPVIQLLGGGEIQMKCRSSIDSGRASINPEADALTIAYRIDHQPNQPVDSASATLTKVKRTQIDNPDDGTTKVTFTKASFVLELGGTNSGCTLQYYCRWIKSKYPNLAGPWTGPFSLTIS